MRLHARWNSKINRTCRYDWPQLKSGCLIQHKSSIHVPTQTNLVQYTTLMKIFFDINFSVFFFRRQKLHWPFQLLQLSKNITPVPFQSLPLPMLWLVQIMGKQRLGFDCVRPIILNCLTNDSVKRFRIYKKIHIYVYTNTYISILPCKEINL